MFFNFAGGIPRIFYAGTSSAQKSYVLVMQLLGKSLAVLQKEMKDRKFSPKTVYMIGIQLVGILTHFLIENKVLKSNFNCNSDVSHRDDS